jgi:hypothetical protein
MNDPARLQFDVAGELRYWRGPSPYHFVALPPDAALEVRAVARLVTYGWGVIPVRVRIGETTFATSLFPKDGGYLVPVKDAVRRAEGLALGDVVAMELTIGR